MKKSRTPTGQYADIAGRLRAVREGFFGMKQKDFAEAAGVSPKSYSQWESGGFRISIQGAIKLRSAFNISLDFIFTGSLETLPHNMIKAISDNPLLKISNTSTVSGPDKAV